MAELFLAVVSCTAENEDCEQLSCAVALGSSYRRSNVPTSLEESSEAWQVPHAFSVEEDKNSFEECLDAEFDDHIPCTWRYIANCFLLPLTNGGVNGFPWSGVALFFQLNGWPLWKLGLCSFAGFGLRVIMALLYLKVGTWVSLVTTTIHLACCVPALINPFADWAVIMEMIALLGLDSMIPNDAIVFYNYCVLQSLVACYATASTLGGLVYDFAGWRGCAAYHLALQMLQAFLIFTEPAVWASWSEWRHGASVSDIDAAGDRRSTASIVPVMEPPGAGRPSGNPPSLVCDDLLPSPPKATAHVVEGHCTADPVSNAGAQPCGARNSGHEQNKKSVAISRVSFAAPATRGSMLFARGSFAGRESGRVSFGAGGARRSLMSRFPEMPRSSVAVKMSRRSMACGNMIPMSVPREASQLMFFAEEEQEEGSDVRKAVKKTTPRDILLPALLIGLIGFNHNLSYQSEWTLYAVFFAEQHGWQSATWAGLAQTSGDVLGTIIMNFQSRCAVASEEDGFDGDRCQWLWYSLTAKPYTASWILLSWAILNLALTAPSLPAAVAAQVVMGTVFVFSMQAATKMNLFYSLGDGDVFLALQVMRQNFESFGSALAALVSLLLYERVHPLAPFWLTAGVSLLILLLYTLAFCKRVGFGESLDMKEEQRSQRKGLVREKTWQKSTATMAAEQRLSLGSED
ncbi:unnamed protein product [Symbiodinium sp. CCMP2456]|nr:unnamed protein product [Symbiodinium sp. CCMP2456]